MSESLYRFFDADGTELYVGISSNVARRLLQHQGKPWWESVASVTVEHYATRPEVRAAEQSAMDLEHPLHNKVRSVGKTPIRAFRVPDDLWSQVKAAAASRGETVTDVVRRALEDYVSEQESSRSA